MNLNKELKMKRLIVLVLAMLSLTGCQWLEEQRMVAELSEHLNGFDAEAAYAAYLKSHGEEARKLREAAAAAVTMRIHMSGDVCIEIVGSSTGPTKVDEYLPLTEDEVKEVREILAGLEETPAHDFDLWLLNKYDSYFGPQPAPPPFWDIMEFVSADGKVLATFGSYASLYGDAAKAEEYRTKRYRPTYMLPTADVARWKALPFIKRADARMRELYALLKG